MQYIIRMHVINFYTKKYNLNINGNGGTFSNSSIIVKNNKATLPTPSKYGYDLLAQDVII